MNFNDVFDFDFYSRPCGRGDLLYTLSGKAIPISTHAPAGGATRAIPPRKRRARHISTHAPAGGATCVFSKSEKSRYISTHAPAGGATLRDFPALHKLFISTHAPAGGATNPLCAELAAPAHFYSRPCGRGDRRQWSNYPARGSHFYSRPCGRGDPLVITYSGGKDSISTHAPAGGATPVDNVCVQFVDQFLLTPLREGRQAALYAVREGHPDFYSRPCGRGDQKDLGRDSAAKYFYSRPCGRGDQRFGVHAQNAGDDFYSRPCGRGDRKWVQHCR